MKLQLRMRFKALKISCMILIIFLIFYLIGYPFWDTLKSYGIMYFYDKYVLSTSFLNSKGIEFNIPGGRATFEKDWYPLMLHHDASSYFSDYTGKNLDCIILYSFGAFDFWKGSSNLYNPSSQYHGAFYGGYAIFNHDNPKEAYGFNKSGKLIVEDIKLLPSFDYTGLVLPSVGCPINKSFFKVLWSNITENTSYLGIGDWTRVDAAIMTNAPTHKYMGHKHIGYIQYGKPHKSFSIIEDYSSISLLGRLYVRYFEDLQGTIVLYVMAKDKGIIDACDKELLSHTTIDHVKQYN